MITLGEHTLTFCADDGGDEEEEREPEGTRVFSVRELSAINTRPAIDAAELQRQNRVLAILSKAASELVVHRPLGELFDLVLELLLEAVTAERGAILLLEGGVPQIKASRSRSGDGLTRVSRSIARRVIEERVSLLLPNVLEDARFRSEDSILASGIRTAMCAPLWVSAAGEGRDSVIGLVYVDSIQHAHAFTEDDLRVLTALANVAAAKIENVRLLEESLEKRRMEEDMRMAAEIQTGLLPSAAPRIPGWDLAGSNQPCRTVGGDYYDFAVERGRLLLALGDVSGKGTGAALLMTVLRAAVRAHWMEPSLADAVVAHQPHRLPERAVEQVRHLLPGVARPGDRPPRVRERRPQPADPGARVGRGGEAHLRRPGARHLRGRELRGRQRRDGAGATR